jgi:hypothetical protein
VVRDSISTQRFEASCQARLIENAKKASSFTTTG